MNRVRSLFSLARKSAWNRRSTLALIVLTITLSTCLLLAIERLRSEVRESFTQALSGTDLVVGARGSALQLVLYSVFHLGEITHNMSMESAETIAGHPDVAWTVPLSLGDSHRGFPSVATRSYFFTHYKIRGGRHLLFSEGNAFSSDGHVVLGSEVAKSLGYGLGKEIRLSHGNDGHGEHAAVFTVCGILRPTGTPVDSALYITLSAMDALHESGREHGHMHEHGHHGMISALLVGCKARSQVFALQQYVNGFASEALMGVLPTVAMNELWNMLGVGERVLLLVSALVTVVGLCGLIATILAGLGERRRELAILRSVGARPLDILLLLFFEGSLLVSLGMLFGVALLSCACFCLSPVLAENYGIFLSTIVPGKGEVLLLLGIFLAGIFASLLPAYRAYKMSLSDGLSLSL